MTAFNLDNLTQEELRDLQQKISELLAAKKDTVPAEPLTDPLEIGGRYYCSTEAMIFDSTWVNDEIDKYRLRDKCIFPYTPEGRLGAELRADVLHPGIHWQEDVKKLNEWNETIDHILGGNAGMSIDDFLNKYLNQK